MVYARLAAVIGLFVDLMAGEMAGFFACLLLTAAAYAARQVIRND